MKPPELSVIVPAHNEETLIGNCLDTVLEQLVSSSGVERPEVIVVASACTDATRSAAEATLAEYPDIPSTSLSVRKRGKKTALNTGLMVAQGEVVLCVDGDVALTPGAIQRAHDDINREGMRLVGGQIAPVMLESWVDRRPAPSMDLLGFAKRQVTRPHKSVRGCFEGFFRKDLPDGFGQGASPDDTWLSAYMGTRFGLGAICVNDEVAATYVPPMTLRDLQDQMSRYRMAQSLISKEYPDLAGYFDALAEHWRATDGTNLLERWEQRATELGLDFPKWIQRYEQMLRQADRQITSTPRLPRRDLWRPQLTTKRLAPVRTSRQLTMAH